MYYDVTKPPYSAGGTGSTDDSAAIQGAINAAQSAGGGVVYFPAGTYSVTGLTLTSAHSVTLMGDGVSSRLNVWNAPPNPAPTRTVFISCTDNLGGFQSGIEIRNLYFDGSQFAPLMTALQPIPSPGIPDAITTTVPVVSGSGIANTDYLQIDAEIVQVTSGGGTTTLIVTRGVLGTTAASHDPSAPVVDLSHNGLYGIKMVGFNMYNCKIDNVLFYNVPYAIWWDRVNESNISNITLLDNSTIYIGSLTDVPPAAYSFNCNVYGVTHYTLAGGNLKYPGAIINLERAVGTHVYGFHARALQNVGSGISIRNDCQAVAIIGGGMGGAVDGVQIFYNTVGTSNRAPLHTLVLGANIDGFFSHGIHARDGLFSHLMNNLITDMQSVVPPLSSVGIYAGSGNQGLQVHDNCVQGGLPGVPGNGMIFDWKPANPPSQPSPVYIKNFSCQANYFDCQNGTTGHDIVVAASGSDNYIILGNLRDANDVGAGFISNAGGGVHQTVTDNQDK